MIHVSSYSSDASTGDSGTLYASEGNRVLRIAVASDKDGKITVTIKNTKRISGNEDEVEIWVGSLSELLEERYSIHELVAEVDHLKHLAESRGVEI